METYALIRFSFQSESLVGVKHKVSSQYGGSIAQWLSYLLPDPAAPGLIPDVPEKFSEDKMLMRLINSAGERKVARGLKILTKPI